MSTPRRSVLLATAALTLASALPALAQEKVVVGFDGSYPPFASVGTDGELKGFDVDLVKSICASEKLQCDLRNVPFDGIFAALEAGKIDVIAAGMAITEERKKKYAMPGPYLKSPLVYMALTASTVDGTTNTLTGKTVGTVAGSVLEKYLNENMASVVQVNTYDSMDAAVLDLDSGRLDAVLGELAQLQPAYIQVKSDAYKIAGEPIFDAKYAGLGKGLIIRLDDKSLAKSFDDGLATLIANGTHAQLTKKWFGVEMPAN
ncbi:transporter substrate-binding domain-containing protein [Sinorhizobium terangae]|uniref:transporter substrate-binding domain-containing protein n=1 Tax=Sinorhizobium terangae TaxID=110322 RepID=UPI0024B2707B|nr:transporter substrate-binding domain-containing protein [Sinorhizobium terangae]WFU51662.1 transporter substrate-binding domain-containing protein [Sinorhizobium terangae]